MVSETNCCLSVYPTSNLVRITNEVFSNLRRNGSSTGVELPESSIIPVFHAFPPYTPIPHAGLDVEAYANECAWMLASTMGCIA